jgi:hypothetical protein
VWTSRNRGRKREALMRTDGGRTLSRVPGVTSAAVDFELGAAIINGIAETPSLVAAVGAAGYGTSVADGSATKGENSAPVAICRRWTRLYAEDVG